MDSAYDSVKITSTVNDLFIRGGFAFLATKNQSQGLQIFDVRDKNQIVKTGHVDFGEEAVDIDCEDSLLYVATPTSIRLISNFPSL